ncbi:unnamed protein product (macronuclear) [Paramecium tetraurelia]|uniref:Transmembrane protein n=1 Tax=Paramecium tetraurelia TaxID=5888 RepID=A0D6X7_PARTE|nr:uncharacterized protein GSPATT00001835001 [Paramecium tetraurelia]CAK78794.1 unnamed protein product [Paramecium tetraurelia]|eukprot:XP_001446191.1 hypothetical protein (macronuclear) [Paramecium tetraurelia strain d4-2]
MMLTVLKDIFYRMTIDYTLFKAQIQLIDSGQDGLTIYIVRIFLSLYLIILYFITNKLKKYNIHNLDLALTGLYYVSAFLTMFFVTFNNQQRFLISDNAEAYFFAFSAVNQLSLKFKYMFFYILLQQAAWFVQLLLHEHNNLLVFIVLSTIILVIVSHNNFELTIKNFNSAANENLKKSREILYQLIYCRLVFQQGSIRIAKLNWNYQMFQQMQLFCLLIQVDSQHTQQSLSRISCKNAQGIDDII